MGKNLKQHKKQGNKNAQTNQDVLIRKGIDNTLEEMSMKKIRKFMVNLDL